MGNTVSESEKETMKRRIADWLRNENLDWARGKTRDEIFAKFGNNLLPVAYIPMKFLAVLGDNIEDNRVYSGKGYFVDHAVNHHPTIASDDYQNMQEVINNFDDIKESVRSDSRAAIFVKKLGRYHAVVVQVEANANGKLIFHKSYFNQKKKPYANEVSLRPFLSCH